MSLWGSWHADAAPSQVLLKVALMWNLSEHAMQNMGLSRISAYQHNYISLYIYKYIYIYILYKKQQPKSWYPMLLKINEICKLRLGHLKTSTVTDLRWSWEYTKGSTEGATLMRPVSRNHSQTSKFRFRQTKQTSKFSPQSELRSCTQPNQVRLCNWIGFVLVSVSF